MIIATSAEQRAAVDAVEAWATSRATPAHVRAGLDAGGADWAGLWGEIAELGLFAAGVPEAAGGAGGSYSDTLAMLAACGASLVPGPLATTAAAALALSAQSCGPAAELLDGRRPAVVPARVTASGALDVVDGVADLGPVAGWTPGALIVVPLRFGDASQRWCVVDGGAAESMETVDGTASPSRVVLTGLRPGELTELHDGSRFRALLVAGIAAYQSGVARATLRLAVDYAKVRTQFGAPIGSFQAIKHLCADMLCRSEQLAAAVWDLGAAIDDDAEDQLGLGTATTAALAAELPLRNAQDAIQVLGGIGFTFEHDAHLYLRSAMSARTHLAAGEPARRELAALGRAGVRRSFRVDLAAAEGRRGEIAALADRVAAVPAGERRGELARTGLLAPHWPPPYGLGADAALQLLIDAELDRVGVVRPDLVIAGWVLPTLLEHGTAEQRERFVAPALAGDVVWCQLFSEPEAGSDLASLRTRAVRGDGGWRLTGQKIWTSEATRAQWGVALARTDPDAPKHRGITYFLIDMSSAGIDVRPLRELTGRSLFNEVFLDDVWVPDDCVVGEVNRGWGLARTTLANERVAMGGGGLGKEVDALLEQIGDAVLSDAQTSRLGAIVADAHIGRVLDARAVAQRLSGTDPGATSSVRKLIGVTHRQAVPEFALDLLGAEGLAPSRASELFLLNRCLSIAGGTTQILRNAAAERILGLPRS
ncbi:MAG: acyl-CoA dehydrogenase [Gordonia sp. (in: high G+C Gram-positive bacteria)]